VAQVLSPLDRIALRANMAVERHDVFAAPDKLTQIGLYARYSTGKQKQKSIDRQVSIVTAYMLSLGFAIYVLYADPARSARSTKNRESLQRLLADCRAGKIRIIMVEDFDRWSRETFDAVELCEELMDLGVEFHSAGDRKALNKKEVVEAALKAEADRDRRSLIMSMGRFQHAAAGGAHSGEFFGYRYGEERGYLVRHEPEADVIVSIFEMAATGVSFRNIGRAMKARGAPGPSAGCKWTKSTVANLLRQIAYTGRWYYPFTKTVYDRRTDTQKQILRHPSEMSKMHFEELRIVSDELFYAVNARRRPRRSGPRGYAHFLEGKATCDCAGAEGQRFVMSRRQMVCGRHLDGDACPARSRSVMTINIERAVLDAVGGKLRSIVGEEDFATAVDRSLRETAERRRSARAEAEREAANVRAQLMRLLDEDIQGLYPPDILSEKRTLLGGKLADAEAALDSLVELPEVLGADERLRALSDTLRHIDGRLPFRAATEGESRVSMALSRLVRGIEVRRAGYAKGRMRLRVELDFFAFLHEDDGTAPPHSQSDVVEVDVEQFMGRHARLGDVAAVLTATGEHRIDDARWTLVADMLPDVTSRRADSRHLSTRDVVDALLLRLRTGLPLQSTACGDSIVMARALARFVYAAGDQILLGAIGKSDPGFVEGLDLHPVDSARSRWKLGSDDWRERRGSAARMQLLDGHAALDDLQWAASAPLLHPCVEMSYKGTGAIPGRPLLEAVIFALRTGLAWQRVPKRFGEARLVLNGMRRLVRSGSWDKLVAMWSETFPELVDGLDVERLAKWHRGSAQWRGPSPKRSRYARSGGVPPAEARPRRHGRATSRCGRKAG
jgi:DNA invertase Pin-like site-specific DNA recombinase/transposase